MINEGSRHDSNEFLNDIARDRYLLAVPSMTLIRLRKHINEIFNTPNSVEQNEKIVLDLQIMVAALQELSASAFSSRELKFLNNEIRPELLQKIKQIRNSYRNVEIIELLDRLLDLITKLNPDKTASLFNLDYDAIARRLIKPAGLALAASLALSQGRNDDQKQDKTTPIEEVKMIPITPNFVVKEDEPTLDKRGKFVQKIIKALKNGTFEFGAYFDELEADFEDVSAQEMQLGKSKIISILENIIKNKLTLPDLKFIQEVSGFAKSPKDDIDNRNFRASSNELLADEDTIGNCEARARTTYRLIEKTRPALRKNLRVIHWKEHQALGYVADDGSVYQFDAGTVWKIPQSLVKKIIVRTPEESWVEPFINPQPGESEEKSLQTSSEIKFDSSKAPEMPGARRSKKENKVEIDKSLLYQFRNIFYLDRDNLGKNDIALSKTLSLGDDISDLGKIYKNIAQLKNIHHADVFAYYDYSVTSSDTQASETTYLDPAVILNGIKKMNLKGLKFITDNNLFSLSDFNRFKNIHSAVIYMPEKRIPEVLAFIQNHELKYLEITPSLLNDQVINEINKQDSLAYLEIFESRKEILKPQNPTYNKMTELRKGGYAGLLTYDSKPVKVVAEDIKTRQIARKNFYKINGNLGIKDGHTDFLYEISDVDIEKALINFSEYFEDSKKNHRHGLEFIVTNKDVSPRTIQLILDFISKHASKVEIEIKVPFETLLNLKLGNLYEKCLEMNVPLRLLNKLTVVQMEEFDTFKHWKLKNRESIELVFIK